MPSALVRRRKGYEHEIEIREHRLIADEPEDRGGTDTGPKPTELLAASLASCTAITIEMYADRKEWDLGQVEVTADFTEASTDSPASFKVNIKVPAELDDDQRERTSSSPASAPSTARSRRRTCASKTTSSSSDVDLGLRVAPAWSPAPAAGSAGRPPGCSAPRAPTSSSSRAPRTR